LSGVSRWLTPRKALIQQTCRHMADDHFWFTLFHEAAHILLHSRKTVFVEGKKDVSGTTAEEDEANSWAANFLIPRSAMAQFIAAGEFSLGSVRRFAREQEIAPGIVVGQLQKAGAVGWNSFLGQLKVRYQWKD
jgi:HTH-type transcriptional regulator/antitoxin HigA